MQIKKGIPVSPGVAISQAVVLDAQDQPVPRRTVAASQVNAELKRFEQALAATAKDIELEAQRAVTTIGPDLAKIFSTHLALLQDKTLLAEVREMVTRDRVRAEFAVYSTMRNAARRFQSLDNNYFRERAADMWDLERRLVGRLLGKSREELKNLQHEAIVIAHDLTPSQTATLDKRYIKGLATDAGGQTSHTAIMAHALGIPAIVATGDLTSIINTGDTVIIDGNRGLVIVDPDASQLLEYRLELERLTAREDELDELAWRAAKTTDGTDIDLLANIEFPSEIALAVKKGATGVGLYRTEFLFLASETTPTEDQQYEAYREAIRALAGKVITIRTLDLGADKLVDSPLTAHHEANPFLGCRSIRLCLQNLPLFKTQLRAILRASVEGPVRIMFPMISSIRELRQAKMILNDVREDLEEEGIPFKADIPVGIMIEVPSAAIQAAALAHECSFFSIGTNDLIQYTVAVDRGNERIASLYSAAHPAVIELVKNVVRAANRAKIEVSICGEMAGEPEYVVLLLGLGLRTLSVTPPALPEVKRTILSVSIGQCVRIARKVSAFDSDREVLNYLRDEIRKILPEAIDGRSSEA